MKKGVLVFALILLLQFASAQVTNNSLNFTESYNANDVISGKINLSISNEPSNSLIQSNLNQSILLKEFLEKNSVEYSCPLNCSPNFQFDEESTQTVLKIVSGNQSYFGFKLFGDSITVDGISFNVSSDFPESDKIPLNLQFFDKSSWSYNENSKEYSREISYGCYTPQNYFTDYLWAVDNNTKYCEQMSLSETKSLLVGADISGSGISRFKMELLSSTKSPMGNCYFSTPNSSCIINSQTTISAGTYYLCIRGETPSSNYKIASETIDGSCGWYGNKNENPSVTNSTTDYAIYSKLPNFAKLPNKVIDPSVVTNLVKDANSYILNKYNRNCSSGCILPILATGIDQNLSISNVKIDYSEKAGKAPINNFVSQLSTTPADLSFSGILDLSKTGFTVGGKGNRTFSLSIGDKPLFSKLINIISSTSIISVGPTNPPAGAEITFSATTESDGNITKFQWDFGDNQTAETSTNEVKHLYSSIGIYNLTLKITDSKNFVSTKSFEISVGSPRELINLSMQYKKDSLTKATNSLNLLPDAYKSIVEKISNLSAYQDDFKRLESERSNLLTDEEYAAFFAKLQAFNPPTSFKIAETITSPLITDVNKIDPAPINEFIGGEIAGDISEYKNPILQWQKENIQASVKRQKIVANLYSGEKTILMTIYSLDITSSSPDESFLVINLPTDSLYFMSEKQPRKVLDSALVELPEGQANAEFYIKGDANPTIYVSPKLSLLTLTSSIGACNFNKVCESDLQEDYKNCRSDCFPVGPTIFWIILLLVISFLVYTGLAYWYKTRYETFLFKDKRTLYNLLMFITNARFSGMTDSAIIETLKKQNWNSEQIAYAIKKSKGERTGMPELIPFNKISAYSMEKKVKQNINKAQIQGINKW